jgi:hypothetical protein
MGKMEFYYLYLLLKDYLKNVNEDKIDEEL